MKTSVSFFGMPAGACRRRRGRGQDQLAATADAHADMPSTQPGMSPPGSSGEGEGLGGPGGLDDLARRVVGEHVLAVSVSPSPRRPGAGDQVGHFDLGGGAPGGTTSVGALPQTPAGEGSATGAKDTGLAMVVVVTGTVVVVDVVVVVVVVLPAKSRAPVPSTRTATMPTMMPRRMFWRRFARCIASILMRRAAF